MRVLRGAVRGHPTQGTRGELPALLLGWGGTGGARSPSQKGQAAVLGLLSLSLWVSQYGRPIAKQLLLLSCRRATERAGGGAGISSRVGKAGWKRLRLKKSIQQPRARALPAAPSPSLGHSEAPKCCYAAAVCSGPALCWEKHPAERLTCFFFCSLTFPDPAGCAACAPPSRCFITDRVCWKKSFHNKTIPPWKKLSLVLSRLRQLN